MYQRSFYTSVTYSGTCTHWRSRKCTCTKYCTVLSSTGIPWPETREQDKSLSLSLKGKSHISHIFRLVRDMCLSLQRPGTKWGYRKKIVVRRFTPNFHTWWVYFDTLLNCRNYGITVPTKQSSWSGAGQIMCSNGSH